jgi:tektin-1
MAKLMQLPPKFTHPEWVISNQMKYANAEGERAAAERLVDEAGRVIEETDKTTFKVQRDVNKKFDQRLDDVRYWEKEVDDKLEGIKTEMDALDAYRSRLDKAIEAYEEPLHIAQMCLANRQRRKGIDLVHDDPEKELLKEVEVYQGVLALLHRTKQQTDEQMRLNRKAKYNLEKDLADKFAAIQIDEHSADLRNNSAGLHFVPGAAKISANSTTPEQWEDHSNRNILDADKQAQNSAALRAIVDGILQTMCNDMRRQKDETDVVLARRIAETRDAKEKLEGHLAKVKRQMMEVEDTAERLRRAIAEKEAPMKLAQTRLESRGARPNVELCRDAVQYRLVEEVSIIGESVDKLRQMLASAEDSLKALRRRQLEIEDDLAIKANTLYIDETECAGIRRSINIQYY